MASAGKPGILYPYQRAWVDDPSRLKIWVASRQIGKSFALSFEAVRLAMAAAWGLAAWQAGRHDA